MGLCGLMFEPFAFGTKLLFFHTINTTTRHEMYTCESVAVTGPVLLITRRCAYLYTKR